MSKAARIAQLREKNEPDYCSTEHSCRYEEGYQAGIADGYDLGFDEAIEKACEWFEKYLAEIGYPDDWCRDSDVQESGEKRFRKAMEE